MPDAKLVAALRGSGGDTAALERDWGVPCFDDPVRFLALPELAAVCIATAKVTMNSRNITLLSYRSKKSSRLRFLR